jgi:membrane protein YdbS with pleckstrin-like domain
MERPHSRVRFVWVGRALLAATLVAGLAFVAARFVRIPLTAVAAVWFAVAILGTVHALLYYRRWRFEIQDDSLYLVRGVLTEVETAVPYVRVQHVDTQRGPIARLVGLSSLVVYTAGTRGADISIPGLTPARATTLRERLRDLAIESEGSDAV